MDQTRTIGYIEDEEEVLDVEVALALKRTMEQNLEAFCASIHAQYAMMGIDSRSFPVARVIGYLENGE